MAEISRVVCPLTEAELRDIEELQGSVFGSLIYTTPEFVNFIQRMEQCEAEWWLAYERGRLVGCAPLLSKTGPLGRVSNSLPYFGSNGYPVSPSDSVVQELARSIRANVVSDPNLISWVTVMNPFRPATSATAKAFGLPRDTRISQFLSIEDRGADDLLSTFDSQRRRNIAKAVRCGVVIKSNRTQEALEFLARAHEEGMQRIGGRVKPLLAFQTLVDCLVGSQWNLSLALHKGEPIAGLLTLRHGDIVEYFTPAVLNAYRDTQALSLLIFEEMAKYAASGAKIWNWGGTWLSQTGVYEYKRRWGSDELDYHYFVCEGPAANRFQGQLSAHRRSYGNFYVLPFHEGHISEMSGG